MELFPAFHFNLLKFSSLRYANFKRISAAIGASFSFALTQIEDSANTKAKYHLGELKETKSQGLQNPNLENYLEACSACQAVRLAGSTPGTLTGAFLVVLLRQFASLGSTIIICFACSLHSSDALASLKEFPVLFWLF